MTPLSPGSLVIVNLLGSVALLLWGVRMVRTGIVRAWGERLKRFIEARLKNRLTAMLSGVGATMLLQSGTATALIITGLAAAGGIRRLAASPFCSGQTSAHPSFRWFSPRAARFCPCGCRPSSSSQDMCCSRFRATSGHATSAGSAWASVSCFWRSTS